MFTDVLKGITVAVLMGQATSAEELVFGFGWDDMFDDNGVESMSAFFEYHSDPFYQSPLLNLSFLAVIQGDDGGDFFAGLGVHNLTNLGRTGRWFLEASLAIGHFDEGGHAADRDNGTRLRSALGGGVYLTDRKRVSLTIDHILDLDFKNDHPGSESLHLRYTWGF